MCGKCGHNVLGVKCETCSVICMDCFDEKKHIGHKYRYNNYDGMCDCGYEFTINPKGFCDKHYGSRVIKKIDEFSDKININKLTGYVYCLFRAYLEISISVC